MAFGPNHFLVPLQDGSIAGLAGCWSKMYARPLPRVYAIFLFAIEYSAKAQHTTTEVRPHGVASPLPHALLLLCVEPWLTNQWQTEK